MTEWTGEVLCSDVNKLTVNTAFFITAATNQFLVVSFAKSLINIFLQSPLFKN